MPAMSFRVLRAIIFNHAATKSACERIKIVDYLMIYYHKLDPVFATAFRMALGEGFDNMGWIVKVTDRLSAREMRDRFNYRFWDNKTKRSRTKMYNDNFFGRLDFIRCLITHTNAQMTEKQVNAAVYMVWSFHISDVQIELLKNFTSPSQVSASATGGSSSNIVPVAGSSSSVAGSSSSAVSLIEQDNILINNDIELHDIFGFFEDRLY